MESAPFNFPRIIIWLGRLILGGIFLYAGYSKIFFPNRFFWPPAMLKFSVLANLSNFGFQVESDKDLRAITGRLDAAGHSVVHQDNASCCYALGNKGWVSDPSGISWETFHTFGESTVYGNDVAPRPVGSKPPATDACCDPSPSSSSSCCTGAKLQ